MPARRMSRLAMSMPSWLKPASRVIRLRRLRTNSSAPTTSTSESATCSTTSARRRPNRSRVSVDPRLPGLHRRAGCSARGAHRRHQAEDQARCDRQRRGEREDAPVERERRRRSAIVVGRQEVDEESAQPLRQHGAARRADGGNQQAFRQELAHDTPSRRADREADGDLALARGRARQHQVRKVRAGNEQDQPGGREQQPQRRFIVAAQRRHTGARLEVLQA